MSSRGSTPIVNHLRAEASMQRCKVATGASPPPPSVSLPQDFFFCCYIHTSCAASSDKPAAHRASTAAPEASRVAFNPPVGAFRPDPGPGARFSLLKGGVHATAKVLSRAESFLWQGKGSSLWADLAQRFLVHSYSPPAALNSSWLRGVNCAPSLRPLKG